MEDHTRWWSTKKKSAMGTLHEHTGPSSAPATPSHRLLDKLTSSSALPQLHFEQEIIDAHLAQKVKLFVHQELEQVIRSEGLAKVPMLPLRWSGDTFDVEKDRNNTKIDTQDVLDSLPCVLNEEQLANKKKPDAELGESSKKWQQLEEEVQMLKRAVYMCTEKQQKLEEEIEMLKPQEHPVFPSNPSREEGTPLYPMLQEALSAVQSALHVCAVEVDVRVKSLLGRNYQSTLHAQLCDSFFLNFETAPFGGTQVDPNSPNFQRPDNNLKNHLLEEYMDLQKGNASELFALPHPRFKAFYNSRFSSLVSNGGDFAPFQNPFQRKAFLAKLLQNEKSLFFAEFAQLAKAVWLLHKLAFACEPTAVIFRVAEGSRYDPEYMECLPAGSAQQRGGEEVAFMAAPGFTFKNLVLKAQIHLRR